VRVNISVLVYLELVRIIISVLVYLELVTREGISVMYLELVKVYQYYVVLFQWSDVSIENIIALLQQKIL
jgi:hypothetical protein